MNYERFLKMSLKKWHKKAVFCNKSASYRVNMDVTEKFLYKNYSYPICPRCRTTLEREYQSFCDRCGQALSWKKY